MDSLRAWIKDIVLVILFANFIQILLPDNQMRNFVKVVIGFFIVAIILNPILNLVNYRFATLSIDDLLKEERPSLQSIITTGQRLRADQMEQIGKEYKAKLRRQIEALIRLNYNLEALEVRIDLGRDNSIKKINIRGRDMRTTPVNANSEMPIEDYDKLEGELEELMISLYGLTTKQLDIDIIKKGELR